MVFLNRQDELSMLWSRVRDARADLIVVYGRRRVGKTELLAHLAAETRSLYFEATDTVAPQQLRDFSSELGRAWGNELLTVQPLTTWESALTALAQFVGDQRTLVVLDEFQWLARQSPDLETTLNRWWRTTGRALPLTLVLAGSEVSFFEDEVLAGQLYGRRTGQLKLEPFLAKESALFHPGYTFEDRVRVYSICGGIPYYLERFTDDRPLSEHLLTEVFYRTGLLHNEAELMLRQSITDPTNHIAVLRAIAYGYNRVNDVSTRTGLQSGNAVKVLDTLERLGLVERLRPITASPRAKKTSYVISDQFLRFHFRFVEPARSQLRTNELASAYVEDSVLPQFDHHASLAWEEVCRQHVLRTAPGVTSVGRWWGQVPAGQGPRTEEREIDVVGVDSHRTPVAVGMCKWTNLPVDMAELKLLERLLPHVEGSTGTEQRFLFSKSGFSQGLLAHAASVPELHLVTPKEIYN